MDWRSRNGVKMSEEGQTITIGRGQGCDVVLSHVSVSRRHAEMIFANAGAIEIRDLNSTGGTFVRRNGKERSVTQTRLESADILRLGDYEVSLQELLSLAKKEQLPPQPAAQPAADTGLERPKTRMVRCDCGTIKKRGETCPACGT
jgi:pSer/pThr/pTyr-binding forkhead associated (FHA) protein